MAERSFAGTSPDSIYEIQHSKKTGVTITVVQFQQLSGLKSQIPFSPEILQLTMPVHYAFGVIFLCQIQILQTTMRRSLRQSMTIVSTVVLQSRGPIS